MIGDVASLEGPDGKPLPGLATVAIQQARHAAKAIRGGKPGASTPFRYSTRARSPSSGGEGSVRDQGRGFSGVPAFLMYLGVHLYYLGGVLGRRLQVLGAWTRTGFGMLEGRVIEGELPRAEQASGASEEVRL